MAIDEEEEEGARDKVEDENDADAPEMDDNEEIQEGGDDNGAAAQTVVEDSASVSEEKIYPHLNQLRNSMTMMRKRLKK